MNKFQRFFKLPAKTSLAHNTISIDHVKGYNRNRPKQAVSSFCYAPSANMLFAQDGSVRVCCHNLEYIVGNYPAQSISDIWNSVQLMQLRTAMKEFNLSKGCGVCKHDVDMGAYEELPAAHFDTLPMNKPYPVMMEFLLSNICNLECVMCQGDFSSLIRKNREKLPPLRSPYDQNFIEQLKPYLKNLKEARFSGSGEAFAIDIYYEIWEILIRDNPACKIMVQTNGTFMNARIKDMLSRGNFQIGVSLDSLQKEKFENIRQNAIFERVIENIEYFSRYSSERGKKFLIATCVMRSNWDELPGFVEYCTRMNAHTLFHQVHSPEHLSLVTLPAQELNSIYSSLANHSFQNSGALASRNIRHYRYFTEIIEGWASNAEKNTVVKPQFSLDEYEKALDSALSSLGNKFSAADVDTFRHKFGKVLLSFEQDEQKRLLYHRALNLQPSVLVEAILKYPEEYLLAEAGNFFKV